MRLIGNRHMDVLTILRVDSKCYNNWGANPGDYVTVIDTVNSDDPGCSERYHKIQNPKDDNITGYMPSIYLAEILKKEDK